MPMTGSNNEKETALAQLSAATANEETAKLTKQTKTLELTVEQQRERAAKAEAELLKLQEHSKPRRITAAQRTALLGFLSKAEKGTISIEFMAADGESEQFARDIGEALRASGWTVPRVGPRIPAGISTPIGLRLLVDRDTPNIKDLISGFHHIGLTAEVILNLQANPPVQLWVGTKP